MSTMTNSLFAVIKKMFNIETGTELAADLVEHFKKESLVELFENVKQQGLELAQVKKELDESTAELAQITLKLYEAEVENKRLKAEAKKHKTEEKEAPLPNSYDTYYNGNIYEVIYSKDVTSILIIMIQNKYHVVEPSDAIEATHRTKREFQAWMQEKKLVDQDHKLTKKGMLEYDLDYTEGKTQGWTAIEFSTKMISDYFDYIDAEFCKR